MTKTNQELENRIAELEAELEAQLRPVFRQFWDRCKPHIIPFVLGMIVVGLFVNIPALPIPFVSQPSAKLEQQAAAGGAVIPFQERQSLAESLELAADRLVGMAGGGTDRLHVDEDIRSAVAQQPTSGRWSIDFNKILQTASSPDPVKYAENLRLIAKGLKR